MDLDAYFGHSQKPIVENYKSGFVALVGRPNVGKSTLLNKVLGQKVAIISDKPQTTRNKIQGIYTDDEMQAVFFDTPGIHKPKHKLGTYMNKASTTTFGDVDVICYLVDATAKPGSGEEFICNALSGAKAPVFLVINKMDLLSEQALIKVVHAYKDMLDFAEIIPVSALQGKNVNSLLETLKKYLPVGPCYYDHDEVTDQPEKVIMAEIIREKLFLEMRDEIPHAIAVKVEHYTRRENGMLYLEAVVYIERDSQKGIIIGKGGAMLKKIGAAARAEIENVFDEKVFLEIRVKVKKDWRDDPFLLKSFGYDIKNL